MLVSEAGATIERSFDLAPAAAPAAVIAALRREASRAEIAWLSRVERSAEPSRTAYRAEVTRDGGSAILEMSADGTLIRAPIWRDAAPRLDDADDVDEDDDDDEDHGRSDD
ncbi:MAG: hypothetical protein CMJ18_09540 [Phycisphaeraceae bacterium]|nr:hypothetical protein [Phycisphaeraceae bacterium]